MNAPTNAPPDERAHARGARERRTCRRTGALLRAAARVSGAGTVGPIELLGGSRQRSRTGRGTARPESTCSARARPADPRESQKPSAWQRSGAGLIRPHVTQGRNPPGCRRQRPRWRDERRARAVRSCHAGLVPRRVRRAPPTRRSARGMRSRTASTRSSSPRPARARRCRRSSGRSTGSSTRRMRRPPAAAGKRRRTTDAAASPTRILYISPLKALGVDVERNLRSPLVGIGQSARRLGIAVPERHGRRALGRHDLERPAQARHRAARHPHHDARVALPDAHEPGRRDAHERAHRDRRRGARRRGDQARRAPRGEPRAARRARVETSAAAQRIGLSATVRPIDEVARFLGGSAPVEIVAPRATKAFDLRVIVPGRRHAQPAAAARHATAASPSRSSRRPTTRTGSPTRRPARRPGGGRARVDRDDRIGVAARRGGDRRPHRAAPLDDRVLQLAAPRRAAHRPAQRDLLRAARARPARTPTVPAAMMAQAGATAGADPVLAKAHHGSVSKEQRAQVEEELKSGILRCVVATSSLELGIDMGAVDLVIQVEAPPSAASGLQRIGRAGHQVGEVSRAALFPKHRGDVLHTAIVTERMLAGQIEAIAIPQNPLDILAQQTVAACALGPVDVEGWFETLKRSAPFRSLPRSAYEATLDLLAGPLPVRRVRRAATAAHLGPRSRHAHRPTRVRSGSRSRAAARSPTAGCSASSSRASRRTRASASSTRRWSTSRASTTSSRSARRAGGSSRSPTTGSTSLPAFGQPGKVPFWHGDGIGRPAELGEALGKFSREVSTATPEKAEERLRDAGLDDNASGNLLAYLARAARGDRHPPHRPHAHRRTRPRRGRRLARHPAFPVRHASARAVGARRQRPHPRAARRRGIGGRERRRHHRAGAGCRGRAARRGALRLRSRRARADRHRRGRRLGAVRLALPRVRGAGAAHAAPQPGPAQPAVAAASALGAAARGRPPLPDVPDHPRDAPRSAAGRLRRARAAAHHPRHRRAAHPARRDDDHRSRRRSRATCSSATSARSCTRATRRSPSAGPPRCRSIRPCCRELLGKVEMRELLDPDVIAQFEREAQRLDPERRARGVEGVADLLRILGPLDAAEVAARLQLVDRSPVAERAQRDACDRGRRRALLDALIDARRAIPVTIAGTARVAAIEDAGRLRDALGVALPVGIPTAFLEPLADPLGDLVARYARTHGPFTGGCRRRAPRRRRRGRAAHPAAARVAGPGRERLLPARRRPAGRRGAADETEWCDAEVLRRLRMRSLAAIRGSVEPVSQEAFARFLPVWQHVTRPLEGIDGVAAVIEQLAGVPIPASAWESLVLPARVADYTPAMLDELTATGEVVWSGHGSLPGRDGWIALHPADARAADARAARGRDRPGIARGAAARRAGRGRRVLRRAAAAADRRRERAVGRRGAVEPDVGGARHQRHVRAGARRSSAAGRRPTASPARRPARACTAAPPCGRSRHPCRRDRPRSADAGRCSPLPSPMPTLRATAAASLLLDRYGVVTRGAVQAEGLPGGFAQAYRVLAGFEEAGHCRRGLRDREARRGAVRGIRHRRPAARVRRTRPTRRRCAPSRSPRPIPRTRTAPRWPGPRSRASRTDPGARPAGSSCSSTARSRSTSSAAASRPSRSPTTRRVLAAATPRPRRDRAGAAPRHAHDRAGERRVRLRHARRAGAARCRFRRVAARPDAAARRRRATRREPFDRLRDRWWAATRA